MNPHLRPLICLANVASFGALALALAAPVAGAATHAVSVKTGKWSAPAPGASSDVNFTVVHTHGRYEIHHLHVSFVDSCADQQPGQPPVTVPRDVDYKKIKITKAGRFSINDGDSEVTGKVTSMRSITGTVDLGPNALNCTGGIAKFTAHPVFTGKTTTVTETGKSVSIKVGDNLVVDLAENPSTGYSWATLSKPSFLHTISSVFAHLPTPSGVAGAPGRRIITYEATKPGSGRLKLVYRRSFAPQASDTVFTVNVKVTRHMK